MSPDRLADRTWSEVDGARGRLLIVPLGATEQHGPHLPLGTDSTIAVALAEAAAARTPDVVVAPLLPYGSSGEHQDFPGTLSIGAAATELVLVELGRSASGTFDRLLFVNAHGGNAAPLAAAVERLRAEGRDVRAWSPRWGGDAHAGRTETSVMLALDAERGPPPGQRTIAVGREPADQVESGNDAPLSELIGRLRAEGVRAVSPNGVLGDPTGATAAEGRALLAAAIGDLCATLAGWPVRAEAAR
jgi:mycofactocin system creatininase family protein